MGAAVLVVAKGLFGLEYHIERLLHSVLPC